MSLVEVDAFSDYLADRLQLNSGNLLPPLVSFPSFISGFPPCLLPLICTDVKKLDKCRPFPVLNILVKLNEGEESRRGSQLKLLRYTHS